MTIIIYTYMYCRFKRKMQQMTEQMRPPTPRMAQGTREKQSMSASLTKKVHQTAESVMKWKMQLESEIKLRDSKISEYQETIKNMKSSLLSQQQNSESLSHKLQIEMLKRGDVTSRYGEIGRHCLPANLFLRNSTALKLQGEYVSPCSSIATTYPMH
jgi:small-conductance mechanosensitive channel